MEKRIYCLPPVYDNNSIILILGTIPGIESISSKTYYANPRNHFWDFMSRLIDPTYPPYQIFNHSTPYENRYKMLSDNKIALWDTIANCIRDGNGDDAIIDPVLNNFDEILSAGKIRHIVFNGQNAKRYYWRGKNHIKYPDCMYYQLPSTSSQNPLNTFSIFYDWRSTFEKLLTK